ncbi:monovalent cation:proton antiporter-2 (CPA2) family protein [Litoreibacter arenae]|uniref:Glutathione-regulated potassium-efflux system protein n=1 Tax=Litoreibacter arenae DSM 19593 TaxID=1123360 RepID=S9QJ85_9RHOB|nr:monovalent cation:proton antiporter-2 (CPA2) family protein [Litoreibacter arenae]EPX79882.1 glutathione-regulated potassium-efflux system protein [Litoreibacter arenae DSM 19593]
METFLFQSTIYLLAACVAVPLAVRLGLGSVLGYLMAGIVIGPVAGLVGSETQSLQHFAEFGVVMMLFLIGLELEPRTLWDMRHRLLGLGGLQITLTTGLIFAAAMAFGQPWHAALAIGLIFALSSTAIVLQTLNEKGLMRTNGGRSSFSVLLTQDVAVIPMLALIPLLAWPGLRNRTVGGEGHADADHGMASDVMHTLETLPGWGVTLVTLAAIVLIVVGGHYLTRPIFRYIHRAHLREMYTAVSLLFVVGVAALMVLVGLSPALGAFLAGVVLANSEFRHELEADIEPFKGLLLGLFFITVGAGINFGTFMGAPFVIIGLTVGVMAIKAAVLYALTLIFRIKGRDRMLFTLGLAQAGEFGFVLISFTVQQNVLPVAMSETLLLVIALSMLLTPLLFIAYDKLKHRILDHGDTTPHDDIDEQQPIIIAGIGRYGQVVNRLLQSSGFQTTVLDHDLPLIQLMRRFGFKGFFGDPTRPEMLQAAGLGKAKVLVVALDDPAAAVKIVKFARKERPDIKIIARARDRVHVFELHRAGADKIVREMFDSSLRTGRYVLEEMGLTEHDAHEQEVAFFRMDRQAMSDLAELWDPNIPISENEAYLERSKELNRDLEIELLAKLANKEAAE